MKKHRKKKKRAAESRDLSPEAMCPDIFMQHLTSLGREVPGYIQRLRATNGSTELREDKGADQWYRVQAGLRAPTWEFARPTAD